MDDDLNSKAPSNINDSFADGDSEGIRWTISPDHGGGYPMDPTDELEDAMSDLDEVDIYLCIYKCLYTYMYYVYGLICLYVTEHVYYICIKHTYIYISRFQSTLIKYLL
jgi:hypothetical protein